MSVVLLPEVLDYLEELAEILYQKEYLSFEQTARKYVLELYDRIVAELPTSQHRPAPPYFDRFGEGMHYAAFRKNRHTTWYTFFTLYNDGGQAVYLVRYIANNHTVAQHLMT